MSEIVIYDDGFVADGTIVKFQSNGAKGGRLMVAVELPLDGKLTGLVTENLNHKAHISVKFAPGESDRPEDDPNQLTLDELEDKGD